MQCIWDEQDPLHIPVEQKTKSCALITGSDSFDDYKNTS